MRKIMQVVVLVVGVLGAFAATASASWTNTGDTAFTATGGAMTFTVGSTTLSCASSQMTGTAGTSSSGVSWINAFTGSASFTPCSVGGSPSPWSCSDGFTASTKTASGATGALALSCTISGTTCTASGTVTSATYTNPVAPTAGIVRTPAVAAGTGELRMSGTNCIYGVGNMSLTALTFRITTASGGPTPHLGPVLV